MTDFYNEENFDFEITKGDTVYLPFAFYDNNGDAVNVTAWQIKFTVRDPRTAAVETTMYKYHNAGVVDSNDGLFYSDDDNTPVKAQPYLDATNKIMVVLEFGDTDVDPGVYDYDIEIFEDDASGSFTGTKHTPIHARLIIKKEVTSV